MGIHVRLTQQEQDWLDKKGLEINKIRMENGEKPLPDSKLVHLLLETVMERIDSGQFSLLPEITGMSYSGSLLIGSCLRGSIQYAVQ